MWNIMWPATDMQGQPQVEVKVKEEKCLALRGFCKTSGIRNVCHSGEGQNPCFSNTSGPRLSQGWRFLGVLQVPLTFNLSLYVLSRLLGSDREAITQGQP